MSAIRIIAPATRISRATAPEGHKRTRSEYTCDPRSPGSASRATKARRICPSSQRNRLSVVASGALPDHHDDFSGLRRLGEMIGRQKAAVVDLERVRDPVDQR